MEYLYRLFCETENKLVTCWQSEIPTHCPNDAGHSIIADSIAIVSKRKYKNVSSVPILKSSKSNCFESKTNGFKTVCTFVLKPEEAISLKSIVDVSRNMTSGILRLQDITNNKTLMESNFSSCNKEILSGEIIEIEDEIIAELQLKRETGSGLVRLYYFSLER